MASDLLAGDSFFLSLVETGSHCVGEDLKTLCLRGPEKRLRQSKFLQPLLVAVSLGYLRHLQDKGLIADLVLGHSLGEITALAAAGVVSPEQAVTMAAHRGRLMEEAAAAVADGGMMAVMGTQREALKVLLEDGVSDEPVTLANDNAPNQVVLSGTRTALEKMARLIAAGRIGSCRFLSVTGPWHSRHMEPARARFEKWSETLEFKKPRVPIVMNVSGQPEEDPVQIKRNIIRAIAEPVQWRSAMAHVKAKGGADLIEIGPGRVLAGLARANGFGNETRVLTVSSLRDVEAVWHALVHAAVTP